MNNIVWLASYPKSGNTWCRIFLTNLMRGGDRPAMINELDIDEIAGSRELFDDLTGLESSDLAAEEIARLRPDVLQFLSDRASAPPLFVKIHDAYGETPDGRPLVPASATRAALYLLRNPLDVAVSFAHHTGKTLDAIVRLMGDETTAIGGAAAGLSAQLEQRLGSWRGHVLGWIGSPLDLHVVRYEDLLADPLREFTEIARRLHLPHRRQRVVEAMRFSSFERLRAQEESAGFTESGRAQRHFFRRGRAGGWRETLSERQVAALVADHGDVMRRFGYLDEAGRPA